MSALLNQACNASFYTKASLDSCDKWQASLICTWKTKSKEGREREGGKKKKKKGQWCRHERVWSVLGKLNFSPSWGASCAVSLMAEERRRGKKKHLLLNRHHEGWTSCLRAAWVSRMPFLEFYNFWEKSKSLREREKSLWIISASPICWEIVWNLWQQSRDPFWQENSRNTIHRPCCFPDPTLLASLQEEFLATRGQQKQTDYIMWDHMACQIS